MLFRQEVSVETFVRLIIGLSSEDDSRKFFQQEQQTKKK
jgi:hypothetical protein